jgi:cellulose synthase/poly-beta-1,6-N-acetylglucosamine synthase-like glycosyltransferase
MYVAVLLFYITCATTLAPRVLALLEVSRGIGNVLIVLFLLHLNVFWLFGSYYLMLGVFTVIDLAMGRRPLGSAADGPPVALLYVTMNDFQEEAALSCILQTYPKTRLFVLDDSVDSACRTRIDAFASQHLGDVTIVRRSGRQGYKAGSINFALRNHVRGFPYFIVVDADSVLPPSFTGDLVPYFDLADDIGWVQASHAPHPEQKTAFARDLGLSILPLWEVYYGPRNRFGNVIFLGHGGIIRYDVWEQVGGFPEIVSEDLAFSTRGAQHGYRGYFAHHVVSYEDFPGGYRQLRRQQAKYVKGACEYLHREANAYLRSRCVEWFEKMDVLMSCGTLFMPAVVLSFMLVFCMLVSLEFGTWREVTFQIAGRDTATFTLLLPDRAFGNLWTWDYYLATLLCSIGPILGFVGVIARYPLRGAKMLLVSGVPYLSLLVVVTASLVSYVASRRAVFLVTGDAWGIDPRQFPEGFSPTARIKERIEAEDSATRVAELAVGTFFCVFCVLTFNLTFLAFAVSLMLGPILLRVQWDTPLLRPVLVLPWLLICCGLFLGGMNVFAAQGAAFSVILFHF